jgi:hypothetical protein
MIMWNVYGPDFTKEFKEYASGKKKPDISSILSNTDTPQSLAKKGYRQYGSQGGLIIWVHPSGREVWVSRYKEVPSGQEEDDTAKVAQCEKMCDETEDEDECNSCCENQTADEKCQRICKIKCVLK